MDFAGKNKVEIAAFLYRTSVFFPDRPLSVPSLPDTHTKKERRELGLQLRLRLRESSLPQLGQ